LGKPGDQTTHSVDFGGYPLREDDRPGFSQPFSPGREDRPAQKNIDIFMDAGMKEATMIKNT
jgi:hypothetical protein